ncbi:MAG: Do family serine endopeptidase [Gammaproteobacteria bacterium]|nr:Do family serine endopeptidase [Gammaproteobacteria bacterium]
MNLRNLSFGRGFGFIFILLFALPSPAAQRSLPDFSRLVTTRGTAVVNISVTRNLPNTAFSSEKPPSDDNVPRDFSRRNFDEDTEPAEENSLGSGFIISPDGYIITCAHVTENANEILVRLTDRREYSARLVGSDRRSDIALLKIESTGLPTIVIGDPDKLQVGEWVLAIGSPFGFDSSATAGIISAKGRTLPNENYVSFIQTDVPINPGNSGGPLFNLRGEVVGVNSQIYSGTGGFMGVSFAIPIDAAMTIGAQLKSEGRVRRGWLGVSLQDVSRALASAYGLNEPRGALVADVLAKSPAARSDLRPGDIVLEYEGKIIDRSSNLPALVGLTMPGTHARFRVFRRDQGLQTVVVTLGELREESSKRPLILNSRPDSRSRLGYSLGEITSQQRRELDIDHGAAIVDVEEGLARGAGLRPGDVILEVDGKRVTDVTGFHRLMAHVRPGRPAVLRVRRGMATLFLALETGNRPNR